MTIPWIEKYEPKTLEDMVLDAEARKDLEYMASNLGSTILHGLPGTGKNTFMKVLKKEAKQQGTDYHYKEIITSRPPTKIEKNVGDYVVLNSAGYHIKGESRRYLIFDNAARMNENTQAFVQTIQEKYQHINFVFMTNRFNKITDALKSRCYCVEMGKASKEDIISHLEKILVEENVNSNNISLASIVDKFYPSIRDMVKALQKECFSVRAA